MRDFRVELEWMEIEKNVFLFLQNKQECQIHQENLIHLMGPLPLQTVAKGRFGDHFHC